MTKPEKRLHIGAKKNHFPLPCLYTLFTILEEKLFEITKQLLLDDVVRKSHYVSDWLGIKNKQRGQFDTSHQLKRARLLTLHYTYPRLILLIKL